MPDGQDDIASTTTTTAEKDGGGSGDGKTTASAKAPTLEEREAALEKEIDRRVSDAQKKWKASAETAQAKWKAEQDILIADKTKDAETKLVELAAKAEKAEKDREQEREEYERFASFTTDAVGIQTKALKDAYAAAKSGDYFDKKGRFEFQRFKAEKPFFFALPTTANAAEGGSTTGSGGMNAIIRAAAGK